MLMFSWGMELAVDFCLYTGCLQTPSASSTPILQNDRTRKALSDDRGLEVTVTDFLDGVFLSLPPHQRAEN